MSFFKRFQEKLAAKRGDEPSATPLQQAAAAQPKPPHAQVPQAKAPTQPPKSGALEQVRHIVAVGSGKGGVGKSTVALNLAMALHQMGKRVGLVDADIYGPSQQQMTRTGRPTMIDDTLIEPPQFEGIKVISVAMFAAAGQAQLMRGPMAAQVLRQFLTQVAWGELDYLIVDMPPGTGDIQLTLAQMVPLSGAVLVTTPQEVSLLDVRKAQFMFQTLNVPVLGIIENMSYFICDGCEKKHFLFGQGGGHRLALETGVPLLAEIPIDPRVTETSDAGHPILLQHPSSAVGQAYLQIADRLLAQQVLQGESDGGLGYFLLEWK